MATTLTGVNLAAPTGSLLIGTGTNWSTLPIGSTAGQVLSTNGTTASWTNVPSAPVYMNISNKTANFTLGTNDSGTAYTNFGALAAVQFTLPSPAVLGDNYYFTSLVSGQSITVTTTDSISTNIATIGTTGHTLTCPSTAQFSTIRVVATSTTQWIVFNANGPWTLT